MFLTIRCIKYLNISDVINIIFYKGLDSFFYKEKFNLKGNRPTPYLFWNITIKIYIYKFYENLKCVGIRNLFNSHEVLREINYFVIYVFCSKKRTSEE